MGLFRVFRVGVLFIFLVWYRVISSVCVCGFPFVGSRSTVSDEMTNISAFRTLFVSSWTGQTETIVFFIAATRATFYRNIFMPLYGFYSVASVIILSNVIASPKV